MNFAMKISYETKLQHQGYEIHQYSIYHGSNIFGKKCLQYLHINMNHWIITSLDLTSKYMQCNVYYWKTIHDKKICEYMKLKLSELMNIQHMDYTYANVMWQLDQSSCGLFVIDFVVDIAFNLDVQISNYIVNEIRKHLRNCFNIIYIYNFFPKNTTNIYKTLNSNAKANHDFISTQQQITYKINK
jgi:hypothetical protein